MDFSMTQLATVGNLWVHHLVKTDILDATWGVCVIEKGDKLAYTSNGVSFLLLLSLIHI